METDFSYLSMIKIQRSVDLISDYLHSGKARCAVQLQQTVAVHITPAIAAQITRSGKDAGKRKAATEWRDAYSKITAMKTDNLQNVDSLINDEKNKYRTYNDIFYKSKWIFQKKHDDMRDTEALSWILASNDVYPLSYPYKSTKAYICITQIQIKGGTSRPQVSIFIDDGQLNYAVNETLTVKFFRDSVDEYNGEISGESNTGYTLNKFDSEKFALLAELYPKVIVEVHFYQDGYHQFHFDLPGLKIREYKTTGA
ncbi:hypothetical protein DP804_23225 [Salmonella enterica subsp. enterica]|nr:hypothetical protein [Salmonella enterica subsp. enterica serovar Virchow]